MTGDGNCMFRSLSYHIFGHQEEHLATRKPIIEFESLNQQQFAKYLLEVNEPDIELHLKKMGKPFVWGTHIELKVAASYTSKFHFTFAKSHRKPIVMSGIVSVQFALLKS